jgi:hypothetical protein
MPKSIKEPVAFFLVGGGEMDSTSFSFPSSSGEIFKEKCINKKHYYDSFSLKGMSIYNLTTCAI